jgi:hypothetical protein
MTLFMPPCEQSQSIRDAIKALCNKAVPRNEGAQVLYDHARSSSHEEIIAGAVAHAEKLGLDSRALRQRLAIWLAAKRQHNEHQKEHRPEPSQKDQGDSRD